MKTTTLFSALLASFISAASFANAQSLQPGAIETFSAMGDVTLVNSTTGELKPLNPGDTFEPGFAIQTGEASSALLFLSNGSAINLRANSHLEIKTFKQAPIEFAGAYVTMTEDPSQSITELHLMYGEFVGEVQSLQSNSSYKITTPAGEAQILGTRYLVGFNPAGTNAKTEIFNLDGQVISTINNNTLNLEPGKFVSATATFANNQWSIDTNNILDATPDLLSRANIRVVEIQDARGGGVPAAAGDDAPAGGGDILTTPVTPTSDARVVTVSPI